MRRLGFVIAVVTLTLSFAGIEVAPAWAARGHEGAHGGHEFYGGHDFHGGREFREHEFHHRGFGGPVFLGPSIGWDPFWYPYPAYSYAPPVVTDPAPQAYVQQPQAPGYWYYCTEAGAYYPYVQQCPSGWLTVVPTPAQ